mmetsp:Transcript_14202/g.16426  ORF Transcript_14202/g.16426 Transcript_14202/m.16426 type:complete len:101 (-) Transcript_14202:21-323(-)
MMTDETFLSIYPQFTTEASASDSSSQEPASKVPRKNSEYAKAMYYRMRKADSSRLIVTSCNCTASELDEVFCERYFKKTTEICGYKRFKFGGVEGQVVST